MRAEARAKVNLALRVHPPRPDGLHPLRSLMLSIDWSDVLRLAAAEQDELVIRGAAPPKDHNLAWQALEAVREATGEHSPVRMELDKRIPAAAGLAGGSADAAAALVLACAHYSAAGSLAADLGAGLGSDVPFCLVGGLAVVTGAGERVDPLPPPGDFAVGVVVPPLELSTARVYAEWDRLGGPAGPQPAGRHLPPSLRDLGPLANDLWPAAASLAGDLDGWRAELAARWDRPVVLSGSGPALFGYFVDVDEAADAVDAAPPGARAAHAAAPRERGVEMGGGTLA